MDEASLVQSLQHRLADLEHKVQTFRHNQILDFRRYYQDLLQHVPPAIADTVQHSLVQSLSAYPTLGLDLALLDLDLELPDSQMSSSPGSVHRRRSPQPAPISGASGSRAAEPPDSPHDREKEFQGLFTPSYLPLLESSHELARPPPQTAISDSCSPGRTSSPSGFPSQPSPDTLLLPEPGYTSSGRGTDMVQRLEPEGFRSPLSSSSKAQPPSRPRHVRQSTNDTTSSASSERSDSKVPRSALRRSSSSSKPPQSPRRVRFEFMGAEVLPTASPQPSDFIAPPPPSIAGTPNTITSKTLLGDDDFEEPPPRKVSSSEALRALSREPMEEGTVWTVVHNSNPDDILVEQDDVGSTRLNPGLAERNQPPQGAPEPPVPIHVPESIRRQQTLGSLKEQPEDDVDNDDSSDEDFISMAKPKSFNNKKTIQSFAKPSSNMTGSTREPTTLNTEIKSGSNNDDNKDRVPTRNIDADEEDMFHFESGGLSAPPKPKPKAVPVEEESSEEEEEEEEDDDDDLTLQDASETQQSVYATSPAVPISRQSVSNGPTAPSPAKFHVGSLGSYKGRPVVMPVVRNPEIHDQAASLGQFNTFVGGLDGRSGMDEGDLNSFRASFANTAFSGTPRSLTERMMMEEANPNRRKGTLPR